MSTSYHTLIREQAGLSLPVDPAELVKAELDAQVKDMSRQIKVNWLQEEPTREFFKSLSQQVERLETQARACACQYHITNNHQEIIKLLIQAEELRNIIKQYGNTSSN